MNANVFIPYDYLGDEDYTPWVVTHEDEDLLDPRILKDHWETFLADFETTEGDELEDFYHYLGSKGYGLHFHPHGPFVLEFP